ncbi:MAG: ribosome assembly cofactor RimP [Sediminibacterium sp.]|nr:ribosome assembly cofactor RimP [Sediminibacterium sp.]
MITKTHIQALAEDHLKGSDKFVTKITVSPNNRIEVLVDGDNGIGIQDCVDLSRHIEKNLDREKEDFSLEVSSPGATAPLVLPRQYKKHLGRTFEVKLNDGSKAEGELIRINDTGFTLEYSARENKPLGKGKVTVTRQHEIAFNQITESKIKLKF